MHHVPLALLAWQLSLAAGGCCFQVFELVPNAIAAHGRQFYSDAAEPQPQPLLYTRFPTPLEPGAVRLAVLQPPAVIRAAAYQAADAVAQALTAAGDLTLLPEINLYSATTSLTAAQARIKQVPRKQSGSGAC